MTGGMDKKKKLVIVIFSGAILVVAAMAIAVSIITFRKKAENTAPAADDESMTTLAALRQREAERIVRSFCASTLHRQDCEQTLLAVIGGSTNMKNLVSATFHVAVGRMTESLERSIALRKAETEEDSKKALEVCEEVLTCGVEDLQRTINRYESLDPRAHLDGIADDLKTWISGALTHQHTCIDAFDIYSPSFEAMSMALNRSISFTANSLNIVAKMAEPPISLPSWISPEKRRLMMAEILKPNITVALDQSGDFASIGEALVAVPKKMDEIFVIYVKAGVYMERVVVNRSLTNVMMVGEGADRTRISGSLSTADGVKTFHTASFAVMGDGFVARDIAFENAAGPSKHQAVALRVQSDKAIFFNCRVDGYQDTLYDYAYRHFYRNCTVSGTVDFIFGNAKSVFQNCIILLRKPLPNQNNVVAAQGSRYADESTAIVLHNCTITGEEDYMPLKDAMPSYLGRPWRKYARTLILQSLIEDVISPQGWLPWLGDFALDTLFYAEYGNVGPGANLVGRVTWKGVKKITEEEAMRFTVGRFVDADAWIKPTGIPFSSGLLPTQSAPHTAKLQT